MGLFTSGKRHRVKNLEDNDEQSIEEQEEASEEEISEQEEALGKGESTNEEEITVSDDGLFMKYSNVLKVDTLSILYKKGWELIAIDSNEGAYFKKRTD